MQQICTDPWFAIPEAKSIDGGYVIGTLKLDIATGTVIKVPLHNTLLLNGHVLPSSNKAKHQSNIPHFSSKYLFSLVLKYKTKKKTHLYALTSN